MELRSALKISAAAHGALAVWALAAGWFSSDFDEAIEVTEVSLISGAEFAALVEETGSGAPSPGDTALPEALPEAEVAPQPELEPDVPPQPEPEAQAASEPEASTTPEPVVPTPTPTEAQELAAEPGDTPTPAPRVAPRPADRPNPNVAVAPEIVEAAEPVPSEDDAASPTEVVEPTAPEEATTRIVTEATETGGAEQIALAPVASQRPRTRPSRPVPVSEPEPEPVPEPEPERVTAIPEEDAPAPDTALDAAVADALADALAGGGAATGDPGPPMTPGERDALRLAVQECWVVDVGSEAANVTVIVGVSMTPEGQVANNEVRMLSASGGSETAMRAAYDSARRAILRCQRGGYDLPSEKYAQWQEIEMVFNPERMRGR